MRRSGAGRRAGTASPSSHTAWPRSSPARELPGDPRDTQSRYIEAAVNGVLIASLYAPNGNPQPGPKFDYKLAWLARLAAHAAELYAAGVPVVLAGDYNVVPTERDIYPTKSWAKDALVQPESRAALRRILEPGWVDAVRRLHPDAPMYTYWDYKRNRWARDAGLRLDLLLLSAEAEQRLADAGVDRDIRGEQGASDHAPAWVVLRDAAKARRTSARQVGTGRRTPAVRGKRNRQSQRLRAGPCWSSTATRSRTAPITVCRRQFCGAAARAAAPSSALPTSCCGSTRRRSRVPCSWVGTRLTVPTYRHRKFPAYQSGRHFDDALLEQLDALPELVAACGFANAKAPGYEADDFLAAAVAAEARRGGTVLVASGDRDTFQLASETTTILFPVRAGEMARIGPAEVRERYGVDPGQVPDFIALRGDPSDKLPGAPGVGPKGAADLLRKYGTLEAALAAGRFAAQAEMLRLYRSIATMDAAAPLPALADQKPTWAKAADLARAWELNQLADRLASLADR